MINGTDGNVDDVFFFEKKDLNYFAKVTLRTRNLMTSMKMIAILALEITQTVQR